MAIIRSAVISDIPRILDLYRQLTITTSPAESGIDPTEEDFRSILTRIKAVPGLELLVAEEGAELVGSLMLLIVPNLSHKGLPWALIENVIVDKCCRRNGVGLQLMQYAINRAREAGCYRVGLSSDNRRKEAHEFYRSLGFEPSAIGFRMSL